MLADLKRGIRRWCEPDIKGFISLEEINLSRQKQNYRFYLFDKSWYFPFKHVIYVIINCFPQCSLQKNFNPEIANHDTAANYATSFLIFEKIK